MKDFIKKILDEALILHVDKANDLLIVSSNDPDVKKANQETFRNKETLKKNDFIWKGDLKAWATPTSNFDVAKKIINSINKDTEIINKIEDLAEYVRNTENFEGKGNLMDKLTLYVNDLANATDERAVSAEIRRYLTFFSSFRGHSFYNTILIYIQNPNATRVAGFRQWEEKHHRRVKKGAKGIMILAPIFINQKGTQPAQAIDDKELDKEVGKGSPIRFRPVYVFDIADTEPIDERGEAPEAVKWFTEIEPTERTRELYGYIKEVAEDMGITVTQSASGGSTRGYSAGGHINMTSAVEGAGEVSTLVHELAHELMHWKKSSLYYQGDEVRMDKTIMELQAESVAYVVMKHYDLPVEHQPTYIALWKGGKDKILANLKVISNVAKFIIEKIDEMASVKKVDENWFL